SVGGLARQSSLVVEHACAAERRRHPVLRGPGRQPCSAAAARVAALRRPLPHPDPHRRWIYGLRGAPRRGKEVGREFGRTSCTWLPVTIYVDVDERGQQSAGGGRHP